MAKESASSMFKFDFDDEVHLIDNPRSLSHPSQGNTILPIFRDERNTDQEGARASSSAASNSSKQKLGTAASTSPDHDHDHHTPDNLDASNENAPSMNNERRGSSSHVFRFSNSVMEVGSSSGSNNQSLPFNGQSSSRRGEAQQNLTAGPTHSGMPENIDPANVPQNRSNFSNHPVPEPSHQTRLTTEGVVPQFGRIPGTRPENEFNLNTSNHQEQLLYQGMNPTTMGGDDHDQLPQNLGSTDFRTNQQQQQPLPSFSPSSFLHGSSSTGVGGNVNQQQLPNWMSNDQQQTAAYATPPTPPRPPQFAQINDQHQQQQLNYNYNYNYNQQGGGGAVTPADFLSFPSSSTLHLRNSLLPGAADEQAGLGRSLIPGHSLLMRPSMPGSSTSWAQNWEMQQQQAIVRPIPTYPTSATSHHLTNQLFINPPSQGIGGRRSIYDVGESSSSSSSSKRPKLTPGSTSHQPQQTELDLLLSANPFNLPRPVKSLIYDPIYETLGLPIDPHLRFFLANN